MAKVTRHRAAIDFIRASRILFLVLLPLCAALGGALLYEWDAVRRTQTFESASGRIVAHDTVPVWSVAHRPRLTIQLDDAPQTVHAVLAIDAAEQIPDRVTFRYSGDPKAEVHLAEESDPLWLALFFLLTPLAGLGATSWLLRTHRRPA